MSEGTCLRDVWYKLLYDYRTDGIIQEMICKKLNYCTILTIAHRLETIMDSDRVLVRVRMMVNNV